MWKKKYLIKKLNLTLYIRMNNYFSLNFMETSKFVTFRINGFSSRITEIRKISYDSIMNFKTP